MCIRDRDEIEDVLGIRTCPVNWPIGCGKNFKGVYDRFERKITTFTAAMGGAREVESQEYDVDSTDLDALVGPVYYQQLQDDIELLDGPATSWTWSGCSGAICPRCSSAPR